MSLDLALVFHIGKNQMEGLLTLQICRGCFSMSAPFSDTISL